jgi:dihydropteroate synthase
MGMSENFFKKEQTQIMGILNVTPDSFSDGGHYQQLDAALYQCDDMLKNGVDIIDIGGQSTRPGYQEVTPAEEKARILPVIQAIKKRTTIPLSVDTYFPEVAQAALDLGVEIINDIKGLDTEGMLKVALQYPASGLIIMHSRPRRKAVTVEEDIQQFYQEKISVCEQVGIARERLCFDPGIGFGKTLAENIEILKTPEHFRYQDIPLLYGVSRKRTIGSLTDEADPLARDFGSVTASLYAADRGVEIVRVHNVKGMKDALKVWQALKDN